MSAAILVDDLHYAYTDKEAVAGISFSVAPGEVLGFLGPNGAGKSTTIKILTGQLTAKSGRAEVLGEDMRKHPGSVQARMGVSFEEKNLYLEMTAKENIEFFASLFGITDLDTQALLARVDLADRMNDRAEGFSKGMRQRLMVARSLVNKPDVLFLDEPTAGLDPVSAQAIRRIVKEEADRGAAVLLTTHDMHEADQLSDRVAFINEGKILAIDSPESLKLKFGQRSVRLRTKADDVVEEKVVSLDGDEAAAEVGAALKSGNVLSLHSQEATLEDIFIKMAGRGLTS